MSAMSATSRRTSLGFRREPMTRRRVCMRLLVPQRADCCDRHCARKIVWGNVARKLEWLDRRVAHCMVDALEERCHAGLVLHWWVRIGDPALGT